jgi:hypothetical protein
MKHHFHALELEPVAVFFSEIEVLNSQGMDVVDAAAARAHEVMVMNDGVGVVEGRAGADLHLGELAHLHELAKCVVDGRPGDLRYHRTRAGEDLLGGKMKIGSRQCLHDGASLGGNAPATFAKPFAK